jgi:hypothetical protein
MTRPANRHVICVTQTDLVTGQSYEFQDHMIWKGGPDVAATALADVSAEWAKVTRSQDGRNRAVTHSGFRVHSWYERPLAETLASFGPAPMSGPENDRAWINGPGSDAL